MEKALLLFLLLIINLSLFAQTPSGRYFNEIEGTTWQLSTLVDKETFSDLNEFELSLVEIDIDSLKSNSIIWTFNETLKIESIDAATKERTLIFECKYVHDEESKTLKLQIENEEIEFSYIPVSTGAFVRFTKKQK